MRSSNDVNVAKASEFSETGVKGEKSKHAVVEVVENKTGKHYFDKPEEYLWIAQAEVIAQELNRATYPNNPQTIYKQDDDGVHVLSERVEGFISLYDLVNQLGGIDIVADKIKNGEFKHFGTCVVLALKSNEADLHTGNIGIDKNNNFIKIDADWSNGRVRYGESEHKFNITSNVIGSLPMLDTNDFKPYNWFDQVEQGALVPDKDIVFIKLVTNHTVQDDMNAQLLRSMLLTPDFMRTIARANTIDPDAAKIQLDEHLKSRLQLVKSACVNPSFREYMQSDKAEKIMQDYVKQLQSHKLTNGQSLGDPEAINKSVNEVFGQVRDLVNASENTLSVPEYKKFIVATTNDSQEEYASQLFLAIDSQDIDTTRIITQHQPDVLEAKNESDRTPLLLAARRGFYAGFKTLRAANADMTVKDYNGDNCLGLAAKSGNEQTARAILRSNKVDINAVNDAGKSALMHAAENGSEKVLELLVSQGAYLTEVDDMDVSALVYAAGCGHGGCVDLLLQEDEVRNNKEQMQAAFITAIHNNQFDISYDLMQATGMDIYLENEVCVQYLRAVAAYYGDDVLLKDLLRRDNTNLDMKLDDGSTIFTLALAQNQPDCLDVLMKSGKIPDRDAKNALLAAVEDNKTDIAKVLIKNNVSVNITSQEKGRNYTPLMYAIKNGNDELTDLILQKSSKEAINHKAENQTTAFTKAFEYGNETAAVKLLNHYLFDVKPYKDSLHVGLSDACEDGHFDLANVLLAHGANINYADPNRNGETPLMLAVRGGNERFINMIVNHKRFNAINAKNNNGETAADIALQKGDRKLYSKLIELGKKQQTQDSDVNKKTVKNKTSDIAMMMAGGSKESAMSHLQKQPETPQKAPASQASSASASASSTSSTDSKNVEVYSEDPETTAAPLRRK